MQLCSLHFLLYGCKATNHFCRYIRGRRAVPLWIAGKHPVEIFSTNVHRSILLGKNAIRMDAHIWSLLFAQLDCFCTVGTAECRQSMVCTAKTATICHVNINCCHTHPRRCAFTSCIWMAARSPEKLEVSSCLLNCSKAFWLST